MHTQLIEVGPLQGNPAAATPVPDTVCGTCGGGGGYMETVGWWTGWYDDAELLLNRVTSYISFNFDGSRVTTFSSYDTTYAWATDPLGPWSFTSHGTSWGYGDSTQSWAFTHSWAIAENTGFCHGAATDSYYEPNEVRGYGNGDVGGGMDTYAGGPCSGLIHYEYNFA